MELTYRKYYSCNSIKYIATIPQVPPPTDRPTLQTLLHNIVQNKYKVHNLKIYYLTYSQSCLKENLYIREICL